jgi:SpoVK/Ycf46/Vps4 family AAA+-type ATPase
MRALHGPEQAKQWLQKRLVAPVKENSGSLNSCCYGLLLYGAQGCGKTALVHSLAAELKAGLYYVSAQELQGTYERQGHKLLRALFQVIFCSSFFPCFNTMFQGIYLSVSFLLGSCFLRRVFFL